MPRCMGVGVEVGVEVGTRIEDMLSCRDFSGSITDRQSTTYGLTLKNDSVSLNSLAFCPIV